MKNDNTESITNNILYTNFIRSKPKLSEASKKQYQIVLTKFIESTNTPLENIIQNCKTQQNRVTEKIITTTTKNNEMITEKEITKFNVNSPDSYINLYLNTHLQYCKAKNNSNVTLNHDLSLISTFLRFYDVELPKIEKFTDDTKNWNLLTKEDIQYILSDSSISHESFITFLLETGMRVGDATKITIGEFMEATSDYHNFIDIDDFIDNAPDDMIGTWEFIPNKTRRFDLKCITCNGPSSSNRILQNLRRIKNEYIPYANKTYDVNLKLTKDDALFGSRNSYYKQPIKAKSVADIFGKKNDKLYQWRLSKIEAAITNGELSVEDKEKEIRNIPRFHAHALRKYFETMISRNCGDLRLCALMEGHKSPIRTDSSYIKKEAEEVKEAYLIALPDLSIDNMETKVYTSEVRREMEAKIQELERRNEALESEVSEIDSIKERLNALERPSWDEFVEGD